MIHRFRRQLFLCLLMTHLGAVFAVSTEESVAWIASDAGLYKVSAAPASGKALVGRFHQWTVRVVNSNGFEVSGARVSIGGGMPGHGHGLPSQPEVTREIAAGQYLVEGVRFNMQGQWELTVAVESPSGSDVARLTIEVRL